MRRGVLALVGVAFAVLGAATTRVPTRYWYYDEIRAPGEPPWSAAPHTSVKFRWAWALPAAFGGEFAEEVDRAELVARGLDPEEFAHDEYQQSARAPETVYVIPPREIRTECRVHWPLLMGAHALILLLAGAALTWMVRRGRRHRAAVAS